LEQWETQKSLGYQTILQIESFSKISILTVQRAIRNSIAIIQEGLSRDSGRPTEVHNLSKKIGDGCIFTILWSEGSIIIIWDGRLHVDINLFLYEENIEKSNMIHETFLEGLPTFNTILRDEQPRGTGHVVNQEKDILTSKYPHWS
jgi:hypothetical protein